MKKLLYNILFTSSLLLAACADDPVDIYSIPSTDLSIYGGNGATFDEEFGASLKFTEEELTFPSKLGLVTEDPAEADKIGAKWYYNRFADLMGYESTTVEYVPMLYGDGSAGSVVKLANEMGSSHIFSFYHPDMSDAANVTVDDALEKWVYLMSAKLPLCSPAVVDASSSSNWLEPFMESVEELNYRVDYISVEYNGLPYATDLQTLCESVYALYGCPIVVTELSICDGSYTEEVMKKFIKEAIIYLDGSSYIYGYAWNPANENSQLFDGNGDLTAIAEVLVDPTSYDAGRVSESSLPSYVSPTYSDNLIDDGGFEDDVTAWSFVNGEVADINNRGDINLDAFLYSDKMGYFGGSATGGISQTITRDLYEGDVYEFGFVGRIQSAIGGFADNAQLYMTLESGGEVLASTSIEVIDSYLVQSFSATFEVDASADGKDSFDVKIYKIGGDSDVAFVDNIYLCQKYYSDAHIYEKPIYSYYDSTKEVANMIVDGGFELASELSSGVYWVKKATTVFHSKAGEDEVAENMITGRGSLKLVGTSYVNTQQKVTIELGKTYIFGFTARAQSGDGPEGTTAASSIGLNLRGRSGSAGAAISSANSTYGETKLLSAGSTSISSNYNTVIMMQWTVPADGWQTDSELALGASDTEVYINLAKQGSSGTIYVDDVFFYEVDAEDLP